MIQPVGEPVVSCRHSLSSAELVYDDGGGRGDDDSEDDNPARWLTHVYY